MTTVICSAENLSVGATGAKADTADTETSIFEPPFNHFVKLLLPPTLGSATIAVF